MRACSHQCVCVCLYLESLQRLRLQLPPPTSADPHDLWPLSQSSTTSFLQETLSKCRETLLRSSRTSAYLWTLYSKSGVCWTALGHPVRDPAGLRDLHLYKNTGISSESRTFIDPVTPHIFMFCCIRATDSQLFRFIPRRRLDPDGWTLNWWRRSCSSNDAYLDLWCMEKHLNDTIVQYKSIKTL